MKKHPRLPCYLDKNGGFYREDKVKRISKSKQRYKRVKVQNKFYSVHRLVVETFIGEIPENKQVNHINGDKHDNSLENLEIVSQKENTIHAYELGLINTRKGEDSPNSTISEETVISIYKDIKKFMSNKEIAEKYDIKFRLVSLLRNGSRWKHLFEKHFEETIPSFTSDTYSLKEMYDIVKVCDNESLTNKEVSSITGVEVSMISRIRNKKSWKNFHKYKNNIKNVIKNN